MEDNARKYITTKRVIVENRLITGAVQDGISLLAEEPETAEQSNIKEKRRRRKE